MPNNSRRPALLKVYPNEPLARLAEQQLRQAGIRCMARALDGGPGVWGSAYNVAHGLYVRPADLEQAQAELGLPPGEAPEPSIASQWAFPKVGWALLLALVVVGVAVGLLLQRG